MPTFILNKLVRDGMIAIFDELEQKVTVRRLKGEEYRSALFDKLIEEAAEMSPEKSEQALVEEIADVQQVLDDLKHELNITDDQVKKAQNIKFAQKSGFAGGMFVETAELKEGDPWVEYYRKEPNKYKEVH